MHRLLKVQLKKVYGKAFNIDDSPEEFKKFLELVEQSYKDFSVERELLDHTLEVSSLELTRANRDIVKNNELLQSVTESLGDAIFYKDLEFKYIGCNWHFAELAGISSTDEVIGKDDYELFLKEEADHFRSIDTAMLEAGGPQVIKEWVTDAEGNKLCFSTAKSPLLNAKGETIGIVGIARDITKEHMMEKELESKRLLLVQQGRLASMGEMIGNIAHQWRQPLNALGLIVQKIRFYNDREMLDRENLNQSVDKSMELIDGMSNTIDDFREFFNPNKRKERFLASEAIEQAYAIVESTFTYNDIEYELLIDADVSIEGFKNEFSQVVVNLLNNAKDILLEREKSPAKITLTVKNDKERTQVSVCDNGGGVPAEIMPKLFDPYFSTKEEGKGTGIGLYMCKIIVEDHMGGKLSACNTDEGACFTIEV
ncbi:MAG: ATP-binding protein [Campylobacterota bacterium]|nr:ATP-binding protein [Campylobacterota bacterium]